jgi:murein DD-endopeptidase MepM/ murein hydrolase activator NlpD
VSEGEKIGLVSNYMDNSGGTTAHLHFDVQVFTRDGWLWVNPYVTLISAYERMIGGRGREIAAVPEAGPPTAKPHDPTHPEKPAEGEDN